MALLKSMAKLETAAGFKELMQNQFVDLIPCRAFEMETLDDGDKRGVLTVDGEEMGRGGGGRGEGRGRLRLRGEAVKGAVPIIA